MEVLSSEMTMANGKAALPIQRTGEAQKTHLKLSGWGGARIPCRPFWQFSWTGLQCFQIAWLVISHTDLDFCCSRRLWWPRAWISNSVPPSPGPHPPTPEIHIPSCCATCNIGPYGFVRMTSGLLQELISLGSQVLLLLQLTSARVIFSAGLSHSIPGYASQRRKKTLGQRLLGMLPSENSSKRTEDPDSPQEVLKMLIELVSTRPSLGFC